jgi:hypothetical protein
MCEDSHDRVIKLKTNNTTLPEQFQLPLTVIAWYKHFNK